MSGNGDIAIRVYQWCNSSTPFLKKEDQGQNLADPFEMPLPARGQYVAATGKRFGEDRFFSGAFVVFRCISVIFRVFCLMVKRNIVYLQTDGLVCVTAIASYKAKHLNTMSIKGIVGYGDR